MEHALLFIAGLCWAGLVLLLILWDGKQPLCRECGRRHVDNSPERIGGYQPCPPPDNAVPNAPPRRP